ncbi:hypothetical protein BV25DRAFT_1817654 [Artomyces pyxidatus]|uniref:Uncharacterized protein n=1 Tax=Artomyces pyxidatus TaxID=48021 RepID=A0ACB8TJX2_9AGAM|nr:hypothetical protein BV25DRAFT_1817654 [Artomyces pyxidatus]
MGLVVLALRSYLVFQNIFITFKTLRPPPPSSRNNGKPSVRALTQRKRDMKGCMAIWIVWCCLATYEANLERIVSIFIPFYDEIKSVVLVFFILSRARSAEPIYLHVIRPLVKPYVATLDSVLDFIHNVGDFILLVLSLPFHGVWSWWHGSRSYDGQIALTEADSESIRSYGDDRLAASPAWSDASALPDDRVASGENLQHRSSATRQASEQLSRFYAPPRPSSSENHQIWYPPPSSYAAAQDEDIRPDPVVSSITSSMSMPEPHIPTIGANNGAVDEWRLYPPFPSAYPPTPLRPSAGISMPEPIHPTQFGIIPEHVGSAELDASDRRRDVETLQSKGNEQDFGRSLLLPREPFNPGSDGSLSDDIHMYGVREETRYIVSDDDADEQDDYETEEDDFDVTLRTPYKLRSSGAVPMDRAQSNMSIVTVATVASSATSAPSETTGLSTVDHASTLRTRTTSPSASSRSDSSNVTGQKRPLPRSARHDAYARVRAVDRLVSRSPRKPGLRVGGIRARLPISRSTSLRANADDTTSEGTLDGDDDGKSSGAISEEAAAAPKRRRIASIPRAKGTQRTRPISQNDHSTGTEAEPTNGTAAKATITRAKSRTIATRTSLRNISTRTAAAPPHSTRISSKVPSNKPDVIERSSRPVRRKATNTVVAGGR